MHSELINKIKSLNWSTKKKITSSVALLMAAVFILNIFVFDEGLNQGRSFNVTTKSFNVSVLARGELKPAKVFSIKSLISGKNSKLMWAIDEGAIVEKKQVIAQFDTSAYKNELVSAEQEFSDAEATFEVAKKSLEIQKEVGKKETETAITELELAILKAKDTLEGSGILLKEKLQLEFAQASRSYEISMEELADYDLLLEKGHVSKREKAKVADTTDQLLELKDLKEKELANFSKYEWPKLKREAEIQKETAKAEYERTLRLAALEIQRYQNAVVKSERDLARKRNKITKIKENLKNCNILAPTTGQVFYTQLPMSNGRRKIQVGDNIWSGQTFMQIPDTKQLIFEAVIREFDLYQIKANQLATIHLDAFSNKKVNAKVKLVNTLAKENTKNQVNRFSVMLSIVDNIPNGHAGMYGQAEIIITQVIDKLSIPANFIKTDNESSWVWMDDAHTERRDIKVGAKNHQWAVVESGLELNEKIEM